VIAVVGNAKSRTLGEDPKSCLYHFLEADPNQILSFFGLAVLVRTSGNPAAIIRPVQAEIHALDRNLAVFNAETMQEHVEKAMLLPRLTAALLGVFGVAGLVLATVGLYGVMSYSVRRRTREIGIRMALGAPASGVLGMVVRQGMLLAGTGLAIGLALALALSRFTASLLYGISPTDAVTFVGVPAVLAAVALAATLLPAHRASRTDPWIALHYL
jgi:ABC-type lipoprotein release transport system permease subunit